MQIEFFFTCRECGADTRLVWDTSHSGEPEELKCSSYKCGHVSGAQVWALWNPISS